MSVNPVTAQLFLLSADVSARLHLDWQCHRGQPVRRRREASGVDGATADAVPGVGSTGALPHTTDRAEGSHLQVELG